MPLKITLAEDDIRRIYPEIGLDLTMPIATGRLIYDYGTYKLVFIHTMYYGSGGLEGLTKEFGTNSKLKFCTLNPYE